MRVAQLAVAGAVIFAGVRYYRAEGAGERLAATLRDRAVTLVRAAPEEPDYVPTTTVRKGDFAVSLTLVGSLKAAESVSVAAETSGTLVWLVEDSTPVKKGDVLAQLQSDQLQRQIEEKHVEYVNAASKLTGVKRDRTLEWENAKTQLSKAEQEFEILKETNRSAIAQAEAALEFQRTDLALARAQLGKQQRLAEERLVPRTQVDSGEQEVASKEFAVQKAEAALVLQKGQLASDETQKQAEVNRSRFTAELAQRRIADEIKNAQKNVDTLKQQEEDFRKQRSKSTIRAPGDGVVILEQRWEGGLRSLRPGDMVSPQRKLLELPNLQKMTAVCEIEEKDIGSVQRGFPVRITLDPFPDKLFHGIVTHVAPVAKQASIEGSGMEQTKSTFTTTIEIREVDPERLRPGMNATLEIVGATVPHAVYIPSDALFTRQGGQVVYLQRGQWFAPVPVRTGQRNRDYVILRNDPSVSSRLRPGQNVALVEP